MDKYDGRSIKEAVVPKALMKYRSAGDRGDTIFSLPVIRHYGRGTLYLEAANYTRERLTPDNWCGLDKIIKAQSYVEDVREWRGDAVDVNLNDFRALMFPQVRRGFHKDRHLCDWIAMASNLPTSIKDEPWLKIEPKPIAPVVISRSGPGRPPHAVYHGKDFPWGQVLAKYGRDAVFVGTELEHEVFQAVFGNVAWYKTPSLFEVAQVIAGAKLFVGNQSAPHAIAQSLGVATVLEVWGAGANCSGWRANHVNGWDHKVTLPDIV